MKNTGRWLKRYIVDSKRGNEMKGLELSLSYYMEYGAPMIRNEFHEYEGRIAVGLVGPGSECYGFDDAISTDHDFGPAFCMWLTDEDHDRIGDKLTEAYSDLPEIFLGYKRMVSAHGGGRVGVFRTGDFYRKFLGRPDGSLTLNEWLTIPERFFAESTNGRVFRDDLGEFSAIRSRLLEYYPEDVRIKKIAARAAIMAQSGQYNYSRSMRRSETVAARLSLDEFIRSTISMVYLLNKKYQPFYKWAHRGMQSFAVLPEIRGMIGELVCIPQQKEAWREEDDSLWQYRLNTGDKAVELIEAICALVIGELNRQKLTDHDDSFLENHTAAIMSGIKDERIRALHVLVG